MQITRSLLPSALAALTLAFSVSLAVRGESLPEKTTPDARFGNWLYKTPDPKVWKKTEKDGALIFATDLPPGDFCTLTLFAGGKAEADFTQQFSAAVGADQKAKGTVKIEADNGAQPGKSKEGFDVLTRNLRAQTASLHTLHMYLGGHSGDRFDLAAFQTTGDESWKLHGVEASQFLLSLKLANSLDPAAVEKLVGENPADAAPPALPPMLPFQNAPEEKVADQKAADLPAAPAVPPAPAIAAAPAEALPKSNVPLRPLENSDIVLKGPGGAPVVGQKNGKGVDGIKLSQHDMEIGSPSIAVAPDGAIHIAFVEKHRTTYAMAVYHRSSADGGKTWTDAKNLSEDMPGIAVGRCQMLVDPRGRAYAIWRAGLKEYSPANIDPYGASHSNLWFRVLDGGKWSKAKPVHPPGSPETQNDGSLSYFATVDAAGHVQVVWNTTPDKWHNELVHVSGNYRQHLAGVGNGLVFQATLDGPSAGDPREIFLPPVAGINDQGGYGAYCDGLDTLNGYVDSAGNAHFIAAVTSTHEPINGKSRYELIENGKPGQVLDLPALSFHAWRDIPTLLVDAKGRRHALVLYPAGEHPNIRDYLLGSDDEPTVIRAAADIKGTVDGFQAYQGPGGRMVAIMQMNDTGERATGESYVSISTGDGKWSVPVNVTNNAGRKSFASKQTGSQSNVAIEKSAYPGPAAATFDKDGHLLLLMINNEYSLFGSSAFGVTISGGSSSTPTLRFLKF